MSILSAIWDKIVIALRGKRLAVLGERGVGKTTLIQFLTTGTIPEEYEQTTNPEQTDARRFKLKNLSLNIKKSLDVSGDKTEYDKWKLVIEDSDIVLYLLRVDKLMKGDKHTKGRIQEDMNQISRWLEKNKKKFPLFIIGTHCDRTDPDFTKLPKDEIGDYVDRVRRMPSFKHIERIGRKTNNVSVVLGSLKTIRDTERLIFRFLSEVA